MKTLLRLTFVGLCAAGILGLLTFPVWGQSIPVSAPIVIYNTGNNIPGTGPYSPSTFTTNRVLWGNGSGAILTTAPGGSSIVDNGSGGLTAAAAGTNQSITLTPSGTGTLNIVTGADNTLMVGNNVSSAYNVVSLNGSLTDAGFTGFLGGATVDAALYVQSGAGNILFRAGGNTIAARIATTGIQIDGTRTLKFGATAAATIGVSADTTAGVLTFTAPSAGSFSFDKSVGFGGGISDLGGGSLQFKINGTQYGRFAASLFELSSGTTFQILGAAAISGGAGNMTITAGTGNSRTLTLQSTTSGGTATTGFVMDATQGITLASLSGSGSRAVLADANGLLSAPVSDETVKENLRPLPDDMGLATVLKLNPLIYNYKDRSRFGNQEYIGFGARETSKILPQVTGQDRDGVYYMSKEDLTASLVKGMQQQQAEIDWLKAELTRIRN